METTLDTKAELPRYAQVNEWCRISGVGRTVTYQRIAAGEIRAVKVGKRTLVDVTSGLAWLDSRPAARITMPAHIRNLAAAQRTSA